MKLMTSIVHALMLLMNTGVDDDEVDDEYCSRVVAINEYIGVDDDEVDDEYCSRVDCY